jgi:hypothetical protein
MGCAPRTAPPHVLHLGVPDDWRCTATMLLGACAGKEDDRLGAVSPRERGWPCGASSSIFVPSELPIVRGVNSCHRVQCNIPGTRSPFVLTVLLWDCNHTWLEA